MEKLNTCPICEGSALSTFKEIKDHFLSQETFHLSVCEKCGFVFTNPRPDENELEKYYQSDEYLSHSKKKKGLITFLYDTIKKYALENKYKLISEIIPSGKILDIGCATGEFLNVFQQKGWECFGIEPSKNPRDFAIENYKLDVKPEEEIEKLGSGNFDVITLWHVLEHVPKLNERIEQIYNLLKPDGLLLIALPNYLSWDSKFYDAFWAGYDVPRHLYHFSPNTISSLLNKHKFSISEIRPMKFDSFYVSLLSEKYKHGSLRYFSAFTKGLKSNFEAKKEQHNYSSLIYLAKKKTG